MHPVRAFLVSLATALALLLAAAPAPGAPTRCANSDSVNLVPEQAAAAIACLVNEVRVDHGLVPLRDSRMLGTLARARRDLLLACDEFSHLPCGQDLDRAAAPYAAPARRWRVGENLQWRTGSPAPRQVVARWLASPHHRDNMLAPVWREQALGVARGVPFLGRRSAWVWVHWFGRREL